jgi:predicted ATPase
MLDTLHVRGFKSWADTGLMRLAPLTGLFGTISSGKTSLLQFLLMLKQTTESADRSRVLHTGGDRHAYVDLGTFRDLVHRHDASQALRYSLGWSLLEPLALADQRFGEASRLTADSLFFAATIQSGERGLYVEDFSYRFDDKTFGMCCMDWDEERYGLRTEGYDARRVRGLDGPLPEPVRFYGFPKLMQAHYQNVGFLDDLALAFENLFARMHYLGPLREPASRFYAWSGGGPDGVGSRGERAVAALLASRQREGSDTEARVATWFQKLGLIHDFALVPVGDHQRTYEVRVRTSAHAAEVALTDVGFGVAQVLPVLTLCFYVPEGSVVLLEQPELHLHPSVQSGLADALLDAIQTRGIQVVLESHSEHLLRRLQRRIAEEQIGAEDVALYFTSMHDDGASRLTPLDVDAYGNIANWPDGFFGDEMGDLVAMAKQTARRRKAEAV